MRKQNIVKKIIILVLILAVPGFLYYLLTVGGKNRYHSLNYFGPKKLSGTFHKFHGERIPDTLYHALPAFSLTDQYGKNIASSNFDKKIIVASFFYTRGGDVCKAINDNMAKLMQNYRRNDMVKFVSITVDPAFDTPQKLLQYEKGFNIPPNSWMLLTGDTASVYPLIRKGFLRNAFMVSDSTFDFSDDLVLIDAEKHIRGYYKGTSAPDVNKLNDEIKVQIAEELRKIK